MKGAVIRKRKVSRVTNHQILILTNLNRRTRRNRRPKSQRAPHHLRQAHQGQAAMVKRKTRSQLSARRPVAPPKKVALPKRRGRARVVTPILQELHLLVLMAYLQAHHLAPPALLKKRLGEIENKSICWVLVAENDYNDEEFFVGGKAA